MHQAPRSQTTHETLSFTVDSTLLREQRPGTILSRGQLEEAIYGWGEEIESNAIDVLIHYLRRRFDKEVIANIRGSGWMVSK
jgi:DNA-binding response OmpR family regulator